MNVFAVIEGELHTPALTGTILAGITRQTLLEIAQAQGMTVYERRMPIDDLLQDIQQGRCTELFACGTAAIISPIAMIGDVDGTKITLPNVNQVAAKLKHALLDVQEGRTRDVADRMVNAADMDRLVMRCQLAAR